MSEPIYFAGALYGDKPEKMTFGIVHPSKHPETPYITHDKNGLKTTSAHASIYGLCPDGKTAVCVNYRTGKCPATVLLSDNQIAALKNGILVD